MAKYLVALSLHGDVEVEADSKDEAISKALTTGFDEISLHDQDVTDVVVLDKI